MTTTKLLTRRTVATLEIRDSGDDHGTLSRREATTTTKMPTQRTIITLEKLDSKHDHQATKQRDSMNANT